MLLRDPIRRLESHYNFIDKSRHKDRPWLRREPGCLLDFMLDPQGYENDVAWLGTQERFEESCVDFERISGYRMEPVARRWNQQAYRERFEDLSRSDRARVLDFHMEDIEFHARMCLRFDRSN